MEQAIRIGDRVRRVGQPQRRRGTVEGVASNHISVRCDGQHKSIPYAHGHWEADVALPVPVTPVDGKNPQAVALGRLGGLKGGTARANALSPERRREIAKLAAEKRWGKS